MLVGVTVSGALRPQKLGFGNRQLRVDNFRFRLCICRGSFFFHLVMAVAFFFSHRKSHHLPHRDDVPTGADNKLQPGFSVFETTYIIQYLDKVFSWIYGAVLVFFFFPLSGIWGGLACFTPSVIAFLLSFLLLLLREGFSCYQAAVIGWGGVFKGVPGKGGMIWHWTLCTKV